MPAVKPLPWATLTIPAARSVNNAATPAEARQLSVAGARTIVRLTYGQDRIGGDILNVLPKAGDPTRLLVQLLWGFAGSAVDDVRLNGLPLSVAATVTTYLGTQTSTDAALVAAFAAQTITYTDTLAGFAYSVIDIPQSVIGSELQFTCLYSGVKMYDPRKDTTAGGSGAHRLADVTTYEYSDNPALALGNFLHNTLYGAAETVDWASVSTTANANDVTVGSPAEKRRLIGVTFTSASSVSDTAEALRAYAGCFLLPSPSGAKLLPDADDAFVATYAHADGSIVSIAPLQLRDLGNSPTSVEIIYTDTTVTPWRDNSAFADLPGAGTTLPFRQSQVRMPGVKRYSQARREAIERLNKLTLQDLSTTIEVLDIGIRHQRGDVIRLSHPIGVTNKLFRVTDIEAPQPGRWLLTLIEHDPACYSSVVETVPTYANSGALISAAGVVQISPGSVTEFFEDFQAGSVSSYESTAAAPVTINSVAIGPFADNTTIEMVFHGTADVLWDPDLTGPYSAMSFDIGFSGGSRSVFLYQSDNQGVYKGTLHATYNLALLAGQTATCNVRALDSARFPTAGAGGNGFHDWTNRRLAVRVFKG